MSKQFLFLFSKEIIPLWNKSTLMVREKVRSITSLFQQQEKKNTSGILVLFKIKELKIITKEEWSSS